MGKTRRRDEDRGQYLPRDDLYAKATWGPPQQEQKPAATGEMKDQEIICRECKNMFIFSIDDQSFFREKQYKPPVRCRRCRAMRRENKGNAASK